MSNVMFNKKLHTTMHIVMCSAGLHELYGEWPVAVFTDPLAARDWCDHANEYGAWMMEMNENDWKEQVQIEHVEHDESMSDEEYFEASRNEPSTQYEWAIHGSPGQVDEWEEEFEEKHPGGDWDYYWAREVSLLLNPYDDRAYWARNESYIEYKVVDILLDPERPYFP